MRSNKTTYLFLLLLMAILFACNSTRNVPNGYHLVNKNTIVFTEDKLDVEEIEYIIRQKPNRKVKLYTYNWIDSTKALKAHIRKFNKAVKKNKKRIQKQNDINTKRIEKARLKGDSLYTERIIPLKDTINLSLSFREWIKFKRGEKPVIFDTSAYKKTIDQLQKYLVTKGYYYGSVSGKYEDDPKNAKKRNIIYTINSGKPYVVTSYEIQSANYRVKGEYERYLKEQLFNPFVGEKLDQDMLDEHRYKVTRAMKDQTLFGFSPTSINFEADTNKREMSVKLKIILTDRKVKVGDSTVFIPYRYTSVSGVYFHILDTVNFKGSYKAFHDSIGEKLLVDNQLRTYDTLFFNQIHYTKQEVKKKKKDKISVTTEMNNPWRSAYVLYNGKPSVKPFILELQNYMENKNKYKEYYIERSYNRLVQLDVFQSVRTDVVQKKGTDSVEMHYYLIPQKKQAFNFEQRFNNSNGYLGLSASVNYNNKNLFRGSEKLTLSFGGGFESQPPVFEESLDGTKLKSQSRSFNTFEIGPSVKLDLPGLFLLRSASKLTKRRRPRTVLSAAFNYQKRTDFERQIFQFNYLWKYYMGKTQVVQFGVPAAAVKFVRINPSLEFKDRLNSSNDLFLKNTYSNQFVWENFKLLYEYNNKQADVKKKYTLVYNTSITSAGWLLDQLNIKDTTETGQKAVFGVAYSRFIRMDNDVIYSKPLSKKASIHARALAGFGIPRGNNTTALPFDYSFFAGGSNDNRGWRARTLGPGSYKYYLDTNTNRSATQIGDVRLGLFGELRYTLTPTFKTAFFVDAGNIWTYQNDEKRAGGQFEWNRFYKEIALSTGFGLRIDMTFLVIRFDLGFPITNPALPNGSKWWFQYRKTKGKDNDPYLNEGIAVYGTAEEAKKRLPKPFIPQPQFGIGFPF